MDYGKVCISYIYMGIQIHVFGWIFAASYLVNFAPQQHLECRIGVFMYDNCSFMNSWDKK